MRSAKRAGDGGEGSEAGKTNYDHNSNDPSSSAFGGPKLKRAAPGGPKGAPLATQNTPILPSLIVYFYHSEYHQDKTRDSNDLAVMPNRFQLWLKASGAPQVLPSAGLKSRPRRPQRAAFGDPKYPHPPSTSNIFLPVGVPPR